MKKSLTMLSNGLLALTLTACGGSSGGDSAEEDTSQSTTSTNLPSVPGYGIVTDIVDIDLNKDGENDLILFRTTDEPFYAGLYIQALINNGDKTFTDESDTYFPLIGNNWKWIDKAYLVDINNDGLKDIVGHIDQGASNLPPLIQQVTGEFKITTNTTLVNNKGAMLPIDVDADDDIDILVRTVQYFGDETEQAFQWTLLENITTNKGINFQSQGVVSNDDRVGWDNSAFAYSPVVIDINNDGYQDFIYGGPKWKYNDFITEQTPLSVYINSQLNTFSQKADEVFTKSVPTYTHVREMLAADFNNNGYQDILIANTGYDKAPYPGERNAILTNLGSSFLEETTTNSTIHNYEGFTHSTDVGDIDADGDFDIVYTDILGNDVSNSQKVRILKNDGTGKFSISSYKTIGNNSWTSTKLSDLNNDNYPDLILGGIDSESKSIVIWNDGSGNL